MKAEIKLTGEQSLPPLPEDARILLLTETSRSREARLTENFDPENLTLRANRMTVVLQNILEHSGYSHGGLND